MANAEVFYNFNASMIRNVFSKFVITEIVHVLTVPRCYNVAEMKCRGPGSDGFYGWVEASRHFNTNLGPFIQIITAFGSDIEAVSSKVQQSHYEESAGRDIGG